MSASVYAAPAVTINSPQNTTYSEYGPIPINVTSTEPVSFYFVKAKTGRKSLMDNTSSGSYNSNFYGSRGTINLTIFANNSNGSTTKSVVFTINHSSIINVTTCGFLNTPNTTYVLQNNVSGHFCMLVWGIDGAFDLNGFTIDDNSAGISLLGCTNFKVRDGYTNGGNGIVIDEGSKCQIKNISINNAGTGISAAFFSSSLLEKISINNTATAIEFDDPVTNIIMKNLTLTGNGGSSLAFSINTVDSTLTLQNSNVSGFTTNIFFGVNNVDWYFRNNGMNLTSVDVNSFIAGRVRMFKEHLLKINTTNTIGQGIAASVELIDNGAFARTDRETNTYTFDSNPTGQVFIGTNENGTGETFISERLITVTTDSPPSFEEAVFSPYTLIARSGLGVTVVSNQNVILNSTIQKNFSIDTSSGCGSSLPVCNINIMLDLNNDTAVDTQDTRIIQKVKVGHNVTVNGTKQCNAINFIPA